MGGPGGTAALAATRTHNGVGGEGGWPLYLRRFVELLAKGGLIAPIATNDQGRPATVGGLRVRDQSHSICRRRQPATAVG